MIQIDFYLDFISPFVYLARGRLLDIATRHGCKVAYHPVAIATLRQNAGNTGPSNSQIPAKLAYFQKDYRRWADHYGLPIADTLAGYDTRTLNCGLLLAIDRGQANRYAEAASCIVWRNGLDPAAADTLRRLDEEMGWAAGELAAFGADPEAFKRYEAETDAASARGVFGVPTFMIGDEMWWGNDRLDFLERYVEVS